MYRLLRVLSLIVIISLLAVVGCSKKSTNNDIDTEAMAGTLQLETATMVNNLGYFFGDGLYYLNYGIGTYAKPADTSYYTYDTITHWWTYNLQLNMIDPWVWQINELDSVRFSAGENFQVEPDETTDGLELRIIGDEYLQFNPDSTIGVDYDFDCEYSNANADTIDIDGGFLFGLDMTMSSLEFIYNYDCQFDNVRYLNDPYSNDNYPFAGTVDLALDIHSTGDASQEIPAGDYSATISLVFSESGYHGEMTIEGDHFTWEATWDDISQAPVYGDR